MEHLKDIKVLEGYGIKLHRLTQDKIELVRKWRNDPKIQQYMEYREYITPQMQKAWFKKIDNDNNFYFIIEYEGREIGLINIKDVDYKKKTGEPGIFIYDDDCLNLDVGVRASLLQNDFAWNTLELETLYGHVLKSNKRAAQMNAFFGYEILPRQENKELQKIELKKDAAKANKKVLRIANLLKKMEKLP